VVPELSTRIDYAIMDTRPRLLELIYGPERPRSADEDREQLP
jgi:hypothetical protein